MSVQFGKCSFDGKPADSQEFDRVRPILSAYGPDTEGSLCQDGAAILYRGFHTTKESRNDVQPHITRSGAVITWTGRLDNGDELLDWLGGKPGIEGADLEIVGSAYERWGTQSFSRLIGDWALSIWDPRNCSLLLAKDCIGTQHLYYSVERDQVLWSSILDPLVLLAGRAFELDQEYIAGWLSFFPAVQLTPYMGIQSVPPSCFVQLGKKTRRVVRYWDFDPARTIRYRSDREYEEHFFSVFAEAVRRRLRSNTAVLAELSGGIDSSSIVCMADNLIRKGVAETQRLDTVSYYNDSEPEWNERPYFTGLEEKRGRRGCHINVVSQPISLVTFAPDRFAATPSAGYFPNPTLNEFKACLTSNGNRVVLSGIGGDEVTGGVPTPTPELQDFIARMQLRELAHQLKLWALAKRKPWVHLLLGAIRGFLPPVLVGVPKGKRPAQWLQAGFIRRNRESLQGYEHRLKLLSPLPSFQEGVSTLDLLRRQLGCSPLTPMPLYEMRYPYLDRNLLEFLFAVPRQQLVRPHQRRSLMRRSLAIIVPVEILSRRKAFVSRAPLNLISLEWPRVLEMSQRMLLADLGIVEPNRFSRELERARTGGEVATVLLMRAFTVEAWLKHVSRHRILADSTQQFAEALKSPPVGRDLS
jgi:asparagine synthase (glutamine-hydrolysing)